MAFNMPPYRCKAHLSEQPSSLGVREMDMNLYSEMETIGARAAIQYTTMSSFRHSLSPPALLSLSKTSTPTLLVHTNYRPSDYRTFLYPRHLSLSPLSQIGPLGLECGGVTG